MLKNITIAGLSILFLGLIVAHIVLAPQLKRVQWDFKVYHAAAQVHSQGLNPYDNDVLIDVGGVRDDLPGYVYPPHTLWIFRLFLLDNYGLAAQPPGTAGKTKVGDEAGPLTPEEKNYRLASWIYLGVKCSLLVGLVCLWWRVFLHEQFNVWFMPFCLLAFNGATCLDLVSGNFQLFELALLWIAFAFFVKGQDLAFGTFILLAASIKLTPIVFLGLWLTSPSRRRLIYLGVFGSLFGLLFLASRLATPELFADFLRNAGTIDENGHLNPALSPLVQRLVNAVADRLNLSVSAGAQVGIYLSVTGVILLLSGLVCLRIRSTDPEQRRILVLFLACLTYAVVAPRMKPYSYMLLLPPAFYTLMTAGPMRSWVALFILLLLPANPLTGFPPFESMHFLLRDYYLLFSAALLWGLFCWQICFPPASSDTNGYRIHLDQADGSEAVRGPSCQPVSELAASA